MQIHSALLFRMILLRYDRRKTYRQALLPKGPTEYLIVEESLVNFYENFFLIKHCFILKLRF